MLFFQYFKLGDQAKSRRKETKSKQFRILKF